MYLDAMHLKFAEGIDKYLHQRNCYLHFTKTRRVGIIVVNEYTINRNPEWVALS